MTEDNLDKIRLSIVRMLFSDQFNLIAGEFKNCSDGTKTVILEFGRDVE